MKFSSLSIMASSFASKLMGISTAGNQLCMGSNGVDSPNSFLDTVWKIIKSTFSDLLVTIYGAIVSLLYLVFKWVLTIIDFLFIFIRELIGMNTDYTDLEELSQSDVVFQFIFSDEVISVIKGMIGLAIILIIVFSIFAIVKSEYDFVAHGKPSNSKKGILVNALKSLMLMVLVPVIAIGGILLSNAILKSLYMATAGGTDVSMGTQIFVASGYNSNAYRNYANKNLKIPITFNFDEVQETENVTGWGSADSSVEELDGALKDFKSSSVWNRGLTTFYMFYTDGFFEMDSVDKLAEIYNSDPELGENPYNQMYDMGIHTKREEYYVMADAIDYSLKNRTAIYFKTAEEIYKSYHALDVAPSSVRNQREAYLPVKRDTAEGGYSFTAHFDGDTYSTKYVHQAGKTDEADGAVFMIAVEKTIEYNNKIYTYYYPLLSGKDAFSTDFYSASNQPVVARGIFEDGKNPTAIKEVDGVVQFYRDDLNVPTLVDFFPTISYELPEGVTQDLGVRIIKGGFEAITGVSADQFIPYVYYSFDIFNLFTKTTNSIVKLDNGRMFVDYTFSHRSFTMENLYLIDGFEFNMLILSFSSILLLGVLLKVLFGVALRVLDITLLFITYPAVLSTMPLDNGGRFGGWTENFIEKLLSLYGVVIGINIVLLLFPIIDSLDLITAEMVASAFGGRLFEGATARFLNYFVELLFMLVAFTSIQRFAVIVERVLNADSHEDDDNFNKVTFIAEDMVGTNKDKKFNYSTPGVVREGAQVVLDLKAMPEKVGNVVTGKFAINAVNKAIDSVYSMVPGGAVVKEAKDALEHHKEMKNMKLDKDDIKDKIKNQDTTGF